MPRVQPNPAHSSHMHSAVFCCLVEGLLALDDEHLSVVFLEWIVDVLVLKARHGHHGVELKTEFKSTKEAWKLEAEGDVGNDDFSSLRWVACGEVSSVWVLVLFFWFGRTKRPVPNLFGKGFLIYT